MRWTMREDKLIATALVRSNNEKAAAFQAVAINLGVSKKAVEGRYYRNRNSIDKFAESLRNLNSYFEEVGAAGDIHIIKKKTPWYVKLWNAIQSMLNLNPRK